MLLRQDGTWLLAAETPDPLEQDFHTVFRSEEGQRVLRHLMEQSFIWGTTFDHSEIAMAHNEGRRDAILYILNKIGKRMEKPTEYADEAGVAEMDHQDA